MDFPSCRQFKWRFFLLLYLWFCSFSAVMETKLLFLLTWQSPLPLYNTLLFHFKCLQVYNYLLYQLMHLNCFSSARTKEQCRWVNCWPTMASHSLMLWKILHSRVSSSTPVCSTRLVSRLTFPSTVSSKSSSWSEYARGQRAMHKRRYCGQRRRRVKRTGRDTEHQATDWIVSHLQDVVVVGFREVSLFRLRPTLTLKGCVTPVQTKPRLKWT